MRPQCVLGAFIDEFYLGPQLGWRRVEPQKPYSALPANYTVVVRHVLPSDESEAAFSPDRFILSGAPLYSFVEPISGFNRMSVDWSPEPFLGCPACDNMASTQSVLTGSAQDAKAIFDRARTSWQADRPAYLAGGLAPDRMTLRRTATSAKTLGDLTSLLDSLQ
jgi:hypothetical protein